MTELVRPTSEVLRKDAFEPAPYKITVEDFEIYGPETIFAMTGAAKWIQKHRLPRVGQLDMQATAELLGIPLVFDENILFQGGMEGLPPNKDNLPLLMRINSRNSEAEQLMTFGHEVGHAYMGLSLGFDEPERMDSIEEFCEMFGFRYVLPHTEVLEQLTSIDEHTLLELHEQYGLDMQRLIYFFIDSGLLPDRLYVDSVIDYGKNEGTVHRDTVCKPCRIDFGSCAGQEPPTFVLDFSNQTFGGRFSSCPNDDGSGKPAVFHHKTLPQIPKLPQLPELPRAAWDEPF